ncbi:hypothetical protein ACMT9Y_11745 [Clavibacter tessellarius]|uniref:hypothetical protein n=1 Tax=Clavibacter tessellarius TaxID=31965 RepID=UPI0039EAACBF
MRCTHLLIDGEPFFLSPDQDVAVLRAQLTAAVTAGAAFVDFETARREVVSFLVTGRSSVLITVREHQDDDRTWQGLPAAVTDPDLYAFA